ncbi:MAG: SRPBCC family protein [Pseudomonadota bacterium]
MFGLGRKPKNEPIVVEVDIDIEASADDVFDLLDLASPKCALRERGMDFGEAPELKNRYSATMADMPGMVFHFEVQEREKPSRYVFASWFDSDEPLGALEQGHSVYVIRAYDNGHCSVELTETATLTPGLSQGERASEDAMIRLSVVQDLMKLKLHAEGGADAVPESIFDFESAEFHFEENWDDE